MALRLCGGCAPRRARVRRLPGLAAAMNLASSDASATAFASVYPIALLAKIVLGQLIVLGVQALG